MIYAYDTEFLEDGHTIDLISIGIVAENGREYYAVNADADWDRIRKHEWLMRNVVPHLPITGRKWLDDYLKHPPRQYQSPADNPVGPDLHDTRVKPKWVIANEIREFLLGSDPEQVPHVELWADYGAYDHVALAQLYGRMIDLPEGMPMFTRDLQQELAHRPDAAVPDQRDGVHDALADARHVMDCLRHLGAAGGAA
ncbi:hypothetical protein F4561_006581 [Lipingzhangella halophila]|uniref:3'-5' exoribonuclease Rv2179c-like domain-containing protein n=1 Tax=Lipingzhangella halophila TaxID=1783352 RepID=A0A7W7RP81_9ACTN|nr:3'-5' exoribonuclease [Lipingzhangella halophila]MBB4935672.1 hypothetical protein [Lipingzhangella halophila]